MKILLLFLLGACISVGVSENLSETIKRALGRIKTTLNKDRLLAIRERMSAAKEKIKKQLELTPRQRAALDQKLRSLVTVNKDHPIEFDETIDKINQRKGIGYLLYQGDIVLTERQADEIVEDGEEGDRKGRQAFRDEYYPGTLWSHGSVYYSFFNASRKVQGLFKKGALEWQNFTCLNFFEKPKAKERIEVIKEEGCWSYIGNIHEVQHLSLGEGCETIGTAAHEIGHALGMFHTHSRHDRDRYIQLDTRNIQDTMLDQFQRETRKTNYNYGLPYDYGSIMHYGSKSFSTNGYDTMVPFNEKYIDTMGSPFVSFYELLMMNLHYKCLDKCKHSHSTVRCDMGGFPNPRDCSKCICPGGYGGRYCNERPKGCGKILYATSHKQPFVDVVGDPAVTEVANDEFVKCHYWIQAPRGRRVEIEFGNFTDGLATDGCYWAGVEFKMQRDQRLTGFRLCSPAYAGKIYRSEGSMVPIITYSRVWEVETTFQYRMIIVPYYSLKDSTATSAGPTSPFRFWQ